MNAEVPGDETRTGVWSHLIGAFQEGRSTDDIMAEIRPIRAWDELSEIRPKSDSVDG